MNKETVLEEGFKPLKKSYTTSAVQQHLPSKPFLDRGMSMEFNLATGEKQSSQSLWETSAWEKLGRSRGKTMDRSNSFVGYRSRAVSEAIALKEKEGAIAVVDPFSTGAHLVAEAIKQGYKVVRILSSWDSPVAALVMSGFKTLDYSATVQHNDRETDEDKAIMDSAKALSDLPFKILAVIPGAETGVQLADQLSAQLKLRSNGAEGSLARRHKYLMGEKVRNAGVRAVMQENCTRLEQVKSFLTMLFERSGSTKSVVKPVQSAGSDDVFLCATWDEAFTAFDQIHMKRNGLGCINDSVLVQEFLVGKEYVIDKVSRDGVHKAVAVWEYDKRSVNGSNFIYFGMKLRGSDSEMAQVMLKYADQVLDALGIMQGPSHMEIMLNKIEKKDPITGISTIVYDPCLVEVGSRCHGGEGTWVPVVMECVGYSQVSVTIDTYLGGTLFASLEKDKVTLKKAGRDVDLVSRHGGIVRSIPGDAEIRKMSTFRCVSWEVKPGPSLHPLYPYPCSIYPYIPHTPIHALYTLISLIPLYMLYRRLRALNHRLLHSPWLRAASRRDRRAGGCRHGVRPRHGRTHHDRLQCHMPQTSVSWSCGDRGSFLIWSKSRSNGPQYGVQTDLSVLRSRLPRRPLGVERHKHKANLDDSA